MNHPSALSRQPWIAAVLSLLCTGLGHLYCGKGLKGLVLFLVSLLFTPTVVLASLAGPSTWILWGIICCALASVGIYLYATIDAFCVARHLPQTNSKHEYNHPLVYGLFMLVGMTYPIGSTWFLRDSILEAFYVPASSMTPNILKGDRVLVNKIAIRQALPQRGEIVVFRAPRQRDMRYIKRVIGLPGDTVAVRADDVYLNGKKLERTDVPASSLSAIQQQVTGGVYAETNSGCRYRVMLDQQSAVRTDFPEMTVPEDMLFVLGDNRRQSRDSRDFGCVPVGDLIGVMQYVYWPAGTWRRLGRVGSGAGG